ncbi:MAG TPA: protein translocase subunit SecF [Luteitalea sp.]|nr:protein translocase subunit SecF [Luteitalea sp.]
MDLFTNANYNFTKWRWHAIAFSALIVLLGLVQIARQGMPLGIDFSGGTIVILKFQQATSEQQVRDALDTLPGEKVVQQYGAATNNEVLIRLPQAAQGEQGTSLEQGARQVMDAVKAANIGQFTVTSTEIVGPVIGKDLQRKGIYATLASILGITLYIAFRFRPSFAVGAIAATLHDVIVTFAFLTFFGYELSLNIIAAILTITGYSVNDTIVIFDRVRENARTMRGVALEQQVNTAVNQTLSRTIITAGTTFLSVLALYLFGGEVLEGFAFTMLVGIVSGTYSTVFIASSIAIALSKNVVQPAAPARAVASERPRRRERRNV